MSKVFMRVRTILLGEKYGEENLFASIFYIDDINRKMNKFIKDITIPIIDYASEYWPEIYDLYNLKPGNYFLQALSPSGATIIEDFEIVTGKPVKVEIDLPSQSSREWLSWHALAGNMRKDIKKSKNEMNIPDFDLFPYRNVAQDSPQEFSVGVISMESNSNVHSYLHENSIENLANLCTNGYTFEEIIKKLGNMRYIDTPSQEDSDYILFCFSSKKGSEVSTAGFPMISLEENYTEQRIYFVLSSLRGITLIPVPSPWQTRHGEAELQLAIEKKYLGTHCGYSFSIGDPIIMGVMGYMSIGAGYQASQLLINKKAMEMLYEKIMNPYAASAGGYLLMLSDEQKSYSEKSASWRNWIKNLDQWFDWLPDGAILHSALYFNLGDGEYEEARDALYRAYKRGLPFYTVGLKFMLEGMRYFANRGEGEAEKYLHNLKVLARRADPSKLFLSIELIKN
ncbi:MAG: hypothetical protein ACMUJM_04340 [bacterium]